MRQARKSFDATKLLRPGGYLVAGAVAWLAIGPALATQTLATPPNLFGWQRLAIVQIVLALPVCAVIASAAPRWMPMRHRGVASLACCGAGLIVALLVAAVLPELSHVLDDNGAGFWPRAFVRSAICVGLELPWCLAVESLAIVPRSSSIAPSPRLARFLSATLAVVAALILPAAYVDDLGRRHTAIATDLLERQQLVAAQRVVDRLCATGSERPLRGVAPAAVRRNLVRTTSGLEQRLSAADPTKLNTPQTIEMARALAMLDRTAEARQIVVPLANSRAEAALLLAAILQKQQDWEESSNWYHKGARLLHAMPETRERTAGLVQAIDGIAYNARELGQYDEAERSYQGGLSELPAAAAHFHFQLGRHYQLGGRPFAAIEHFEKSAQLDPPGHGARATAIIGQLAAGSPGCVLAPRATKDAH